MMLERVSSVRFRLRRANSIKHLVCNDSEPATEPYSQVRVHQA